MEFLYGFTTLANHWQQQFEDSEQGMEDCLQYIESRDSDSDCVRYLRSTVPLFESSNPTVLQNSAGEAIKVSVSMSDTWLDFSSETGPFGDREFVSLIQNLSLIKLSKALRKLISM